MDDFACFLFVEDFPEVTATVDQITTTMIDKGADLAARRLLRAYEALRLGLIRMEAEVAVEGTRILRRVEEETRVRPDTGGGGGERLEDHLRCDPIADPLLVGSVGIANETELDHYVPWWPTNEEGSSARVGGKVVGFFIDTAGGRSKPDAELFRQHPLFEPARERGAPAMVIKNEIPERRFIEKSIDEIDASWLRKAGILRAAFAAEADAALAESAAFIP